MAGVVRGDDPNLLSLLKTASDQIKDKDPRVLFDYGKLEERVFTSIASEQMASEFTRKLFNRRIKVSIVKDLNKSIKSVSVLQKTAKVNLSAPKLRTVYKAIALSILNGETPKFFFNNYAEHIYQKKARKSVTDKKRYNRNKKRRK